MPKSFLLRDEYLNSTILTLAKLVETKGERIAIDFSEMRDIEKGDLMVLSAQLEKSVYGNQNQLFREGSFPALKLIKQMIQSSDKTVHMNKPISLSEMNDSEKQKLLNPELIDTIVNDLKKIGIKEYYYPFNVFLTELIGNAVEHGIENKNINWWLTNELDKKNKISKYTFVDMGLGIISSHKKAGLPLKYIFLKNKHIVLDALEGKLGSSTKQSNRGRGLPQLREMIKKEIVGNLVLITNGVSLHYKNDQFITKENPNFIGTYYSWTIDHNNFQKWKNTQ